MYKINIFQISELCKSCKVFLINKVLKVVLLICKYNLIHPGLFDTGSVNFD